MLRLDATSALELDGYRVGVSPLRIRDEDFDIRNGEKKYEWIDAPGAEGAILKEPPKRGNIERVLPLQVVPRFTSTLTNQCTNPRPGSTTGYTAQGAGASMSDQTATNDPHIAFVTTGSADSGGKYSFIGTAAAWCGGFWILAPAGAPLKILFDGAASTAIVATGDWQFVSTEGITLTAAGRSLQILQTDTGSRTIKVRRTLLCIGAAIPTSKGVKQYWDGCSGDAVWTGTPDASTSTTLTGVDAIDNTVGAIAIKFSRAEDLAEVEGISLFQKLYGSSYENELFVIGGDVSKATYDYAWATGKIAKLDVKLFLLPRILEPEKLVGTLYKPAGCPVCDGIVSVGGQIPGPVRMEFTTPDANDQQLLVGGMQFRHANSSITSMVTRGGSLDVTGLSGTITAGINEVQRITRGGTLSGGTGTFTFHGVTTATITNASNAAAIQAVLEAHPYIGAGNVTVTGGPLSSTNVDITFTGKLAACDVTQLTWNNSLSGGGTAVLSTITAGVPGYASANLYDEWTTICGSGNLTDVGDYRIIARVRDGAANNQVGLSRLRLMWSVGEGGPITRNSRHVTSPANVGTECLVDLGPVSIPIAKQGTQRVKMWVEGRTEGVVGASMRIIELIRVPIGVADWTLAAPAEPGGSLVMLDDYNQTSGNYTTKTMGLGGTVSGGGDGDDFTIDATNHWLQRTATSDSSNVGRYVYGGSNLTDCMVTVRAPAFGIGGYSGLRVGLLVRYVDSNNYAFVVHEPFTAELVFYTKTGGGAPVEIGRTLATVGGAFDLTAIVRSNGIWMVSGSGGIMTGQSSVLATSGALASGKAGLYDENSSATAATRVYEEFRAYSLPVPNVVIPASGKKLIVHPDATAQRESAVGVYGELNSVIPNPPRFGPKGPSGQPNRVTAFISRNNWQTGPDPSSDALKIDIYHRAAMELHQGAPT